MKNSPIDKTDGATRLQTGSRTLIPALVAVGGGLAALPASALELGDVKINSSLGQPLRASIAFALGPNEAVYDTCVSLGSAAQADGLPAVARGRISVADGVISISSNAPVREPLMSMRLNVRCPYTPHLSRDYMLFFDPAQPVTQVETPSAAIEPQQASIQPAPAPAVVRQRTVSREPIANATRYRVQPGDSLSQIAQRIENRPIGLWDAVASIFEANPDAFINDDPNRLKAGSWLDIPDFGAGQPLTIADGKIFSTESTGVAADAGATYSAAAETGSAYEPATVAEAEPASTPDTVEQAVAAEVEATDGTTDLKPGDVILEGENPFAAAGDETVVIPDTLLEGPEVTANTPNVPTAAIQQPEPESPSTNWFVWLIGAGLAIIAALLFFGRGTRDRSGTAPGAAVAVPQRRKTDTGIARMAPIAESAIEVEEIEPFTEEAATIADDSPTEENLTLDADLVIGTGLSEGSDVDVAQDFGFAATTDLDLELPEEMSSGVYETPETDVIPPLNSEMKSILESEVLPDNEDDEYDMSVIVDATKMPRPEDVTERDLEAVVIDAGDETLIADDYTVSQEVDYKILEQDYEDEMTATQALNQEIARAAEELATRMDEMDSAEEDTSEMSLASVTALDVTAQLPANDDDDDTSVDEAIKTVNLAEEKTVEMVTDDKTVEMSPDGDNTIEMDIESGRTGSKSA